MQLKHAFQSFNSNNLWTGLSICLLLISIILRVIFLPYLNYDMYNFNLPWYQSLVDLGISNALATNFSNYTPPYTYLLALATLTRPFLSPIIAIKLIPIAFDILGAFYVFRIVKLKHAQGAAPVLAATVYFAAPTIVINSAYWGQADSLYTCFLLICLYALLTARPLQSMLAFGVAFSIKAQAVFLIPFLLILAFQKKIPWKHFLLPPLIYIISILPVVILGRPLVDSLLIYARQSSTYASLSMNAPNLYFILSNGEYELLSLFGMAAAILLVSYWIYFTARNNPNIAGNNKLILYALIAVTITPFLLPKMHDRYFYPADVFSIILSFYWPALWFVPVLYQLISITSISPFLFGTSSDWIVFAALLNTFTIAILLRTQRISMEIMDHKSFARSFTSWLVAGIIPIALLGLSFRLIITPHYFRMYYNLPHPEVIAQGHGKADLYQKAGLFVDFVTNARGNSYLSRFQLPNGVRVFEDQEIVQAVELRDEIQNLATAWHAALVALYSLGLLAWAGNWLPQYRLGASRGGWITIYLTPVLGISTLMWLNNSRQLVFIQLFPLHTWQNAVLFSMLICAGAGLILGKMSSSSQDQKNAQS